MQQMLWRTQKHLCTCLYTSHTPPLVKIVMPTCTFSHHCTNGRNKCTLHYGNYIQLLMLKLTSSKAEKRSWKLGSKLKIPWARGAARVNISTSLLHFKAVAALKKTRPLVETLMSATPPAQGIFSLDTQVREWSPAVEILARWCFHMGSKQRT